MMHRNDVNAGQLQVLALLDAYTPDSEEQRNVLLLVREFVVRHRDCCERGLTIGHLTGSAWVISRDGCRVLLTHHRKLDRWLQPGGHADGDSDLAQVALREAREETGLAELRLEPKIFDLDRHWIPERSSEAGHWHYDVRFALQAGVDEAFVVSAESHALAWKDIAAVAADAAGDASLRRMAQKWLARVGDARAAI